MAKQRKPREANPEMGTLSGVALRKMGACASQVKVVVATFGKGIFKLTPRVIAKAVERNINVPWLAERLMLDDRVTNSNIYYAVDRRTQGMWDRLNAKHSYDPPSDLEKAMSKKVNLIWGQGLLKQIERNKVQEKKEKIRARKQRAKDRLKAQRERIRTKRRNAREKAQLARDLKAARKRSKLGTAAPTKENTTITQGCCPDGYDD